MRAFLVCVLVLSPVVVSGQVSNTTVAQGTANQVLVNGTTGTVQAGLLTLTTPQNIATTSTVRFGAMSLNHVYETGWLTVNLASGIRIRGTNGGDLHRADIAMTGGRMSFTSFNETDTVNSPYDFYGSSSRFFAGTTATEAGSIDTSGYWWLGGVAGTTALRIRGADTANTIYKGSGDVAIRADDDTLTLDGGTMVLQGNGTNAIEIGATGTITTPLLTASRLVSTGSSSELASVSGLQNWIAGTTNQITVTDDTDGTVTLSAPQDLHTGATPQFAGLGIGTAATTDDLAIAASDPFVYVENEDLGDADISQTTSALKLTAGGMSTSFEYTPSVMFGSTDPQFTTTNPKMMAAINGRAVRSYSADGSAGMAMDFFTTLTSASDTVGTMVRRMTIDDNGYVGIGDLDAPGQNLHIRTETGDTSTVIRMDTTDDTTSNTVMQHAATQLSIAQTSASGSSLIDIAPVPSDGTSEAAFRFFRSTNTSGSVRFDVHVGDGTATQNASIAGSGDTFFAADNGNVGIGINTGFPSTGTKGLVFGDGTALSSMSANTAGLYANADAGGVVRMVAIDENDEVTDIGWRTIRFNATATAVTGATYVFYGGTASQELDLPAGVLNAQVWVKNTGTVSFDVDPNGTEEIFATTAMGAGVTLTVDPGEAYMLQWDGVYWVVM